MVKIQNFVIWIQDSFIVHVKTGDIYKDFPGDVKTRFDNSNFEIYRPSPKRKIKKVIGLMKGELGGQNFWIKSKNIKLFKRQQ